MKSSVLEPVKPVAKNQTIISNKKTAFNKHLKPPRNLAVSRYIDHKLHNLSILPSPTPEPEPEPESSPPSSTKKSHLSPTANCLSRLKSNRRSLPDLRVQATSSLASARITKQRAFPLHNGTKKTKRTPQQSRLHSPINSNESHTALQHYLQSTSHIAAVYSRHKPKLLQ